MRYIAALHQGVLEAILYAAIGSLVVRRYGIHSLLHPEEYRGRHVGTGRGKRWRGHDLRRHEFKALGHMAISVDRAIERTKLVFLPKGKEMLPVYAVSGYVTTTSWYHDRLLEGFVV